MSSATTSPGGQPQILKNCFIRIPNADTIRMKALPDISDSKSASYNDESIIGRSFPLKTYSHSENRAISMQLHFFIAEEADIQTNLRYLRALESAVYPQDDNSGAPFIPPPVCRIRCGSLLAAYGELCAILKSYSVKFPTDVAWDESSYLPYKFDVDTSWEVVYRSTNLPGQSRIFRYGA